MAAAKRKLGKQLYEAVLNCNIGECKLLIAKGASPNYTFGINKDNALCAAIFHEYTEIALFLLDNKADPEISDDDGQRPIHFACETGNVQVFEALIARGVDIHSIDAAAINSLGYAMRKGSVHICRRLINLGATFDGFREEDVAYLLLGHPEVFMYMIESTKLSPRIINILHEKSTRFKYKDYLRRMKELRILTSLI